MNQPSLIISPLSETQQQEVTELTHACIDRASELFGITCKPVDISFDLRGRAAGMYRVSHRIGYQKRLIRYNSLIFSKFYDDNIATTIPHEVAHYVSDIIHGLKNIRPHGKEWKRIMRALDADAAVTANYDLSGIPLRKLSLHTYQCSCREHMLTSIRHNKIQNKRFRYYCNSCKQALQFKTEENLCT